MIEAGEINLAQVKYLWTITNFLKLYREYQFIYSPNLEVTLNNVELKCFLLLMRYVKCKQTYIKIYMVQLIDEYTVDSNDRVNVKIELDLLGGSDNVVHHIYENRERQVISSTSMRIKQNNLHSQILVDFAIEEHVILNYLHKNELKLILSISTNDVADQIKADDKCRTLRLREFDHFGKMLNNEKFSDVVLCVEGEEICAHKIILANKSPVFEAMFTHDMSEMRSNKVNIADIDYDTMCELLLYIYTGKLSDDAENDVFDKYSNVFVAADKYGVESLKMKCELKLSLILTAENVLDCLLLADIHHAVNLRKEVMNFIVEHAEEIVQLPSYENFMVLYADVSVDVRRALNLKKRRIE